MKKHMMVTVVMIICLVGLSAAGDMQILICNDDGYQSPGILALAKSLGRLGTVTVVAPLKNSSGVGHGITYRDPILIKEYTIDGIHFYALDALPATCIRWAIDTLFNEKKPDLVVSGINRGENIGMSIYYSGTCGVAREATICGIPAIAVSSDSDLKDYTAPARVIAEFVEKNSSRFDNEGFINMNIPAEGPFTLDNIVAAEISRALWRQDYEQRTSPRNGDKYFWIVGKGYDGDQPGTDVYEFSQGKITISYVKTFAVGSKEKSLKLVNSK